MNEAVGCLKQGIVRSAAKTGIYGLHHRLPIAIKSPL
jgi:hypothetical protein